MSAPRPSLRALARPLAAFAVLAIAVGACFDRGDRLLAGEPAPIVCQSGQMRCNGDVLEVCKEVLVTAQWETSEDCAATDLVCAPSLLACTPCLPDQGFCDGQDGYQCSSDGQEEIFVATCDPSIGQACRVGKCVDLCAQAASEKSNVGCEYWAADLDNARVDSTSNAAAQQFAVVVSNPQPDVPATIRIVRDDAAVGEPSELIEIAQATIAPLNLQVFKLGPREVDGSEPGTFNSGSHTALSRAAFRVESDFPVVAYQFNPLENVSVFSNDASLLKPREALSSGSDALELSYVVAGWPQTIAATDDPNTNFNPNDPIHLRSFLTLVGTRPATRVVITPTTDIVGGGPLPATAAGTPIDITLEPFDVLNLETGDFGADFTGTTIESDGPVAVFSGSEAADAPRFDTLGERKCCADHLEDQLAPVRTSGTSFAIAHTPSRTRAILAAGGEIGVVPEPDYIRIVAVSESGATITTTLPPPYDTLVLTGRGALAEIEAFRDFTLDSDAPVVVAQIMASQEAAGVPEGGRLPGGDPSFMIVPPLEQARADYVFLTPDKYAFDFITIVAPAGATVLLDGTEVTSDVCEQDPADGLTDEERGGPTTAWVFRCQLSYPVVVPDRSPVLVLPGNQNDGVHRVVSDAPVAVSVIGFDTFVSYAYAAGTELRDLGAPL